MKKINQGDLVSLKDGLQEGVQYGHLELLKGMAFTGCAVVNYVRKNSVDIGKWTYSMQMIQLKKKAVETHAPIKLKRGVLTYEY
jgi:hypothetical protein